MSSYHTLVTRYNIIIIIGIASIAITAHCNTIHQRTFEIIFGKTLIDIKSPVNTLFFSCGSLVNYCGKMQQSTGYEPNADASKASGLLVPLQDDDKATQEIAMTPRASSSAATTQMVTGGDSTAVKRRLVDAIRSSPTKNDLYMELNDANAKLLHSEGETQRVKAIMSAK